MPYPTYYALQPQASWPVAEELRAVAESLVSAVSREREGAGRKERLEVELAFIDKATHVVLLLVESDPTITPETIVKLAEEIGLMFGETPYDGSNPEPAWTWAGEALEAAGVGGAAEHDLFDADDAEQMVFVPQEAFESVLHEAEIRLRALLQQAKKTIERESLPLAA